MYIGGACRAGEDPPSQRCCAQKEIHVNIGQVRHGWQINASLCKVNVGISGVEDLGPLQPEQQQPSPARKRSMGAAAGEQLRGTCNGRLVSQTGSCTRPGETLTL